VSPGIVSGGGAISPLSRVSGDAIGPASVVGVVIGLGDAVAEGVIMVGVGVGVASGPGLRPQAASRTPIQKNNKAFIADHVLF
jgi:hypothetical protein